MVSSRTPQEETAALLRRYRVEKRRVRDELIRAGVPNAQLQGRSLQEMKELFWRGVGTS